MVREWSSQTPEELRMQADKLAKLADYVARSDVAERLKAQAAQFYAEAELRSLSRRRSGIPVQWDGASNSAGNGPSSASPRNGYLAPTGTPHNAFRGWRGGPLSPLLT